MHQIRRTSFIYIYIKANQQDLNRKIFLVSEPIGIWVGIVT
jgi:hypothetical protein